MEQCLGLHCHRRSSHRGQEGVAAAVAGRGRGRRRAASTAPLTVVSRCSPGEWDCPACGTGTGAGARCQGRGGASSEGSLVQSGPSTRGAGIARAGGRSTRPASSLAPPVLHHSQHTCSPGPQWVRSTQPHFCPMLPQNKRTTASGTIVVVGLAWLSPSCYLPPQSVQGAS